MRRRERCAVHMELDNLPHAFHESQGVPGVLGRGPTVAGFLVMYLGFRVMYLGFSV